MGPQTTAGFSGPSAKAIRVKRLGVLLRVHREHKYLKRIFRQISHLARAVEHTYVLIGADRAGPRVLRLCEGFARNCNDSITVSIVDALPVLTTGGANWMGSLNVLYGELLDLAGPLGPDAAMLWDDDMLLSRDLQRQLEGAFQCFEADRLEARTLFLWDSPDQYNGAFPEHWSTILFRVWCGDTFPLDYVTHSPDQVARSGRYIRSPHAILNYGYISADQRPLIWKRKLDAGLIDAHSLALVRRPTLEPVNASA